MPTPGMAPPTPADTQTVKDSRGDHPSPTQQKQSAQCGSSAATNPSTAVRTADPVHQPAEDSTPVTQAVSPQKGKKNWAATRVRRMLTCTLCRFTCKNSREFTHHRRTAHSEKKSETEQNATRTRSSSRLRRAASAPGNHTAPSGSSGLAKRARVLRVKKQAGTKENTVAKPSNHREELKIKPSPPDTSTKKPAALTSLNEDTARVTEVSEPPAEQAPEESQDSPKETRTWDGAPNPSDSSAPHSPAGVMLSTNGPEPVHNDLGASGASEDEDLGDEEGRLVIDDAGSAGSGSNSGAVPTRCGNIQNRTYMCDDCDYTTFSAQQSLRHKKNAHGYDFNIYACDLCDYATKYKQKLPRHYKLHFPGTEMDGQLPEHVLSAIEGSRANPPILGQPQAPTTSTLSPHPSTVPLSPSRGIKRSAVEAGLDPPTPSVLPSEVILEDGEDDEGDDDELIESDTPTATPPPEDVEEGGEEGHGAASAISSLPPTKKKRKDVSPDKYFEVSEEATNTKYGCAKCGNVYKWKKSLNKHWKEKHGNDPGDSQYTPPGMHILLQQQNHVQTEHRRCCHKTLLDAITVKPSGSSRPPTPQNFLNGHYNVGVLNVGREDDVDGEEPVNYVPSSIPMGPFVLGTSTQPVFPSSGQRQNLINSLNAPIPSASVLDLTTHTLDEPDSAADDEVVKPLDLAVPKSRQARSVSPAPSFANTQPQPSTSSGQTAAAASLPSEEDKEVSDLNKLVAASRDSLGGKDILKCPKCGEVLKTQTSYSNHMAMHLQSANKRVAKCGVCATHFSNNEALNQHFLDKHMNYITSHKEAIQKIPHGLQQTYHLLKMPLQSIPKLSTQETEDPLKCNMCEFTAKWPAELQKHAVSHSDERPFVCMVCGSTYKWKWDLVKHFEKAHSSLPNPYKRREAGAVSATPGGSDSQNTSVGHDHEMEEGEIALDKVKEPAGGVDFSGSYLFEQAAAQDEISVENILRTSQQASLMLSRQPNFLDSPENTVASSSASPLVDNAGERLSGLDLSSLQGVSLAASTSGLAFISSDFTTAKEGMGTRPGKPSPVRHVRGRPKESDVPYNSLIPRQKSGSKVRGPYKDYKALEGSESSDLKYQCVLCEYKARWPSEITQHMKNHSSEKPYGCPNCTYRSKWKWDVVKHLKRCGTGGTIKDVIDYQQKSTLRDAPPNVMVTPEGSVVQAQQAGSPSPGTATPEDPAPALLAIKSEGQNSVLQGPFIASMASSVPSTSTANLNLNAMATHAYVSLILQRSKAASEAKKASALAAGSAQEGSEPPTAPQAETPGQQSVTYNSIINEGQHHCLHCTFVASSLAELRRHQVLHSDEKPYTCYDCSYSTKWKCDMKKHKEKYKHNGPWQYIPPSAEGKDGDKNSKKSAASPSEGQNGEGQQSHMKNEHSASKTSPSGHPKFRCKKCPFSTNELVDWINHRRQHPPLKDQEDSRQSPSVNGAKEHDEARLKHPRKPVKKYSCNKCDFVCLKNTELLDHQERLHELHLCPFCPQRSDTKDTFLDHLVTHQEFDVKEWEFYFMDDSDNEDVNNNTDNPPPSDGGKKGKVSVVDTGSSANTIDLTASSTMSPLPPVSFAVSGKTPDALPCQWCDARFANVIRLYRHVCDAHPAQKREQEIAEGLSPSQTDVCARVKTGKHSKGDKAAAQYLAGKRTPSPAKANGRLSGLTPTLAASMGLSLLHAPTIVAQLGQTQGAPLVSQPLAVVPELLQGLNLSTKKPEAEQTPLFQCMKCAFKTGHLGEYQHHIQSHMSPENMAQYRGLLPSLTAVRLLDPKAEETRCWFCTDVHQTHVELCQHMQAQHPGELLTRPKQWQELMQKALKEMQAYPQEHRRSEAATVPAAAATAAAAAAAGAHLASSTSTSSSGGSSLAIADWLHPKKVLTYKGMPLQALRLSGGSKAELWYKCLLCNVMDRNPAHISKHTRQVHHSSLPEKFQCGYCGHGCKQFQTLLSHHEKLHKNLVQNIIVLQYEELSLPGRHTAGEAPADLSPSPLSPQVGVDTSDKSKAALSMVQPAAIKKEHLALSPPQAASSPVASALDCQPLDLTTEMAEDRACEPPRHKGRAPAQASVAEDKTKTPKVRAAQQVTESRDEEAEKAEVQEIMDAEAASGVSKALARAATKAEEENQQPEFRCKHCPYHTHVSFDFRTHSSCHGLRSRYQCDFCTFSHNQISSVSQHRTVHSHQPGFSPNYIPKLNDSSAATADPAGPSSPATPAAAAEVLRCPDCPYRTTARPSFNIHVSMHGQRSQYICDFCDWSTDRLVVLLQHRNIHSNDPDFDMSPEDSVFANPEYAKVVSGEFEAKLLDSKSQDEQAHSASCSEGQTPPFKLSITKKSYTCPHCPYVTGNRAAYDFHLSQHDGQGCYTCDRCSYRTPHWGRICQHGRLHDEHEQEIGQRSAGGPVEGATPTKKAAAPVEGGSTSAQEDALGATLPAAVQEKIDDKQRAGKADPTSLKDKAGTEAEDDESVEMGEFPDRVKEEEDSNSSAPEEALQLPREVPGEEPASTEEELQCQRCPFRTTSRLLLNQHGKHHSGPGQVVCPCCDYTCPTKETLLRHIQLHFPSTVVDMSALQRMLLQKKGPGEAEAATPSNVAGKSAAPSKDMAGTSAAPSSEKAEPAGEVQTAIEERSEGSKMSGQQSSSHSTNTTRVYACRYCDREFEDKDVMLQHERQHKR